MASPPSLDSPDVIFSMDRFDSPRINLRDSLSHPLIEGRLTWIRRLEEVCEKVGFYLRAQCARITRC